MTPEVKEIIEQIRHGNVPEGYTMSGNAILPQDWKLVSISDVGDVITGSTPPTANEEYYFGNRLFITPSDFNTGIYIAQSERTISDAAYKVSRVIPANSIYVVCIGATVGKINMCADEAVCNQQINAVVPKESNDAVFLYYCVDYFFNRIKKKYIGEQTLPIVSKGQFSKVQIVLSRIEEQKKIEAILATQDKVIGLKEKLLAGKQRQKKYLMQQLLTGNKRLAGFTGEWSAVALRDVATPIIEKVGKGQYEVLSISATKGFVNQAQKFGKDISGAQYTKYTVIRRGDFAYNKGNSKSYPQGCIYLLEDRDIAAVPNVFISFSLCPNCCNHYYKYLFETGYLNHQLYRLINSGVRNDGLLNLNDSDFYNCTVPMPPYEEQKAIAEILTTADREIDLLSQELEAEKQKKKALMQLLLTGIVRVKA